ncbi:hypothetical protein X754_26140 [Mesorhizobium sp. LNJC403B00]|nr:hypothetical protein X754_26140 [Mesorhizobium sp. LNJC403B00]
MNPDLRTTVAENSRKEAEHIAHVAGDHQQRSKAAQTVKIF